MTCAHLWCLQKPDLLLLGPLPLLLRVQMPHSANQKVGVDQHVAVQHQHVVASHYAALEEGVVDVACLGMVRHALNLCRGAGVEVLVCVGQGWSCVMSKTSLWMPKKHMMV